VLALLLLVGFLVTWVLLAKQQHQHQQQQKTKKEKVGVVESRSSSSSHIISSNSNNNSNSSNNNDNNSSQTSRESVSSTQDSVSLRGPRMKNTNGGGKKENKSVVNMKAGKYIFEVPPAWIRSSGVN